jgi:hypothetical protein
MTVADAARQVADDLYCAGAPDDDPLARAFEKFADLLEPREATGDVVAIRGDDIRRLVDMFETIIDDDYMPPVVRVWIDPIDRAVKFKVGNGTWSPPLGAIEEGTRP